MFLGTYVRTTRTVRGTNKSVPSFPRRASCSQNNFGPLCLGHVAKGHIRVPSSAHFASAVLRYHYCRHPPAFVLSCVYQTTNNNKQQRRCCSKKTWATKSPSLTKASLPFAEVSPFGKATIMDETSRCSSTWWWFNRIRMIQTRPRRPHPPMIVRCGIPTVLAEYRVLVRGCPLRPHQPMPIVPVYAAMRTIHNSNINSKSAPPHPLQTILPKNCSYRTRNRRPRRI